MCQYFGIWKEIGIRPDNPELKFDALVFLINWQAVKIAHVCRESGEKERQFCRKSAYDSQRHAFYQNGLLLQCVAGCLPLWMEAFAACKPVGFVHIYNVLWLLLAYDFTALPFLQMKQTWQKQIIKKESETLAPKIFFSKCMFKCGKVGFKNSSDQ